MDRKKVYFIVQSALCIVLALLLCAAALRLFLEGNAYQAAGNSTEWIYTREKVKEALLPILPLLGITLILALTGIFCGIGKEQQDRPAKHADLSRDLLEARDVFRFEDRKRERVLRCRKQEERKAVFRRVLLAAAVCLVLLGILNGSMRDVLVKAIKICTECIGLG